MSQKRTLLASEARQILLYPSTRILLQFGAYFYSRYIESPDNIAYALVSRTVNLVPTAALPARTENRLKTDSPV